MFKIPHHPDWIAGGAYFKEPPAGLKKELTLKDKQGEEFVLYREFNDGSLMVPRELCEVTGMPPWVLDRRDFGRAIDCTSNFDYDYDPEQKPFIDDCVRLLLNGQSHTAQARTGFGKTFTGSEVACQIGTRFCVITTKEDIVDQWIEAIHIVTGIPLERIGVWRGDHTPKPEHDAVVALVQSVCKGYQRYPQEMYHGFGLVICDEVHRMAADKFSQAMWYFPAALRYGLSATARRKDGRQIVFEEHIGRVMVQSDAEEEIPKVIVHRTGYQIPRYKTGKNRGKQHFHTVGKTMQLYKHMGADEVRNSWVSWWAEKLLKKDRQTIIFADTTDHLKNIYDMMVSRGNNPEDIGYYVGLTSDVYEGGKKKRKEQREGAKAKKWILATYKMASEATNIPTLSACIMATPRSDVEQIIGRIRRTLEGKTFPVVIDFYDEDSWVFEKYFQSRMRWYSELGCMVINYN